ncbi:hypothetical protein [Planococcus halotolerans]|uniref:hypothetical protein n=1 Tax=Planococcus halotolerans TaxID=2233542 RepID=UPI0013670B58|nr:hypothetical protein [Planococcus halotolerans]QHJ70859.1 hypothetical protein DNR44_009670 [Planococcus halotolerans]
MGSPFLGFRETSTSSNISLPLFLCLEASTAMQERIFALRRLLLHVISVEADE